VPYSDTIPYVKPKVVWLLAFLLGTPLLGVGVPIVWLWLASRLQGESQRLGFLPLIVLILGLLGTYVLVTFVAHWINPTPPDRRAHPRNRWLEPMASDRTPRATTDVEGVFVACTMTIAVGVLLFLLLFGHPGVPLGT
jgi:hypothetical protein